MSVLAVSPAAFTMSTKEKLPLAFDTTPLLVGTEVPINPVSYMTQLDTGTNNPNALGGVPTISNNIITQIIQGSGLTPGKGYRLEVTFQIGSTKTWDLELTLLCPF